LENQYTLENITESKMIGLWKSTNEDIIFKPDGKGEQKFNNNVNVFNYLFEKGGVKIVVQQQKERLFYLRKNGIVMYEFFSDDSEKIYRKLDFRKQ
jgi:hypothetical protein